MPDKLPVSFLIKKAHIELKVILQEKNHVSIEANEGKPENIRLYHSIARVQTTMAQMTLDMRKPTSPYSLLLSLFDREGWEVIPFTES